MSGSAASSSQESVARLHQRRQQQHAQQVCCVVCERMDALCYDASVCRAGVWSGDCGGGSHRQTSVHEAGVVPLGSVDSELSLLPHLPPGRRYDHAVPLQWHAASRAHGLPTRELCLRVLIIHARQRSQCTHISNAFAAMVGYLPSRIPQGSPVRDLRLQVRAPALLQGCVCSIWLTSHRHALLCAVAQVALAEVLSPGSLPARSHRVLARCDGTQCDRHGRRRAVREAQRCRCCRQQ